MRETVNASFTPYEWIAISKKIEQLGMNRYAFFRYVILKECGLVLDGNPKQENQKSNSRGEKSRPREPDKGNQEPINDIDETDSR